MRIATTQLLWSIVGCHALKMYFNNARQCPARTEEKKQETLQYINGLQESFCDAEAMHFSSREVHQRMRMVVEMVMK